jgi:hypothetical protein
MIADCGLRIKKQSQLRSQLCFQSAIRNPQLGKDVTGGAHPESFILVGRIEASFSPVSDTALWIIH